MRDGEVVSDPGYSTDVVTDNALEFLEERGRDNRPFYLSVHTFAPHGPWDRSCHPPDLWDDYFERCPFRSTPELPMHPWQINSCDWAAGEARRKLLAGYFAAITTVDANVGRLVDRLERLGLRANTLVLFTGDNGMNMGHHGIFGKGNGTFPQNMFEESVKVPAILSCPGRVPAGAVCDELLSHYDVRPTLLELAGIADAEAGGLPGRSFAPILRGEAAPPREPVVVFDEYGPVRMIRDRRWKYVHRYPYGPHELYDLAADPGEEANLIGRDDAGEVAARLKARLDAWFVRYADPARDGVREGVTGKGQLGPAGPAGQGTLTYGDDWHYLGERSA
jgi:arylsulfatase A-like enzyme